MSSFRPKYVTFDCHGTLIDFQMAGAAKDIFGHLFDDLQMAEFIKNFQAYRIDEVLRDWQPYADVVHNALETAVRRALLERSKGVGLRGREASVYAPK